jgi:cytochrome oxidase Cu insertion factor (SCO1/SenC/PrrC family)
MKQAESRRWNMKRIGIAAAAPLAVVMALGSTALLALDVGQKAPDFTLPATTQEKWSLADVLGKKNVVLFGFIGAFTPT